MLTALISIRMNNQMNEFFDIIIKSNTLNFILVVVLVSVLFTVLKFKDKISKLRNEIKDYVENSVQEKETAQENLEKSKSKVEKLPLIIERIEKSAAHNVKNIEERIQHEIEEQKSDIDNNAKRLFNLESKKFNSKLIYLLSEKSIEIAEKNAISQLENNKELHNLYIDSAIEEIDKVNL